MSSNFEDVNVGERLLSVRIGESLSQKIFADSLEINLRTYQNYERGERPISKDVICTLKSKYDIDPAWLLFGDNEDSEDIPEPIILRSFGTLVGMTFKKKGAAIVTMTTPEIRRIIEGCINHVEKFSPLNSEVLQHLNEVRNYLYDDDTYIRMVAEVVIAQHGVKLAPMFPEDNLIKLFPYDDPLMRQIREKNRDNDIKDTVDE